LRQDSILAYRSQQPLTALSSLAGCGRAGIVNILTAVGTRFDRRPMVAVAGGIHPFAAKNEVDRTGDMMKPHFAR